MTIIGEIVNTPYGYGTIIEEKEHHYLIEPLNWKLASDQKPSFYIRKEDVKSYFKVGDNVRTVYGTGIIKTIREDGVHVVTLNNWKLANNASPTLYLQSIALSKEVGINVHKVGDLIQTTYGKGKILEIRSSGIIIVSPTNWILANGKSPIFYLNGKDESLITIKEAETTHDTKTSPTTEVVKEESTVLPRIQRSIELKDQGTEFFQKNDYESAASCYGQALTVLNYIGTNLTNEEKAAVFEQTVPCHNNMALCCLKREKFREAAEFSRVSVELIESLEQKFSSSLVWEALQARGVTKDTLFKKWKRRALIYLGKAYTGLLEFKLAKNSFKSALTLIQSDPTLTKEVNEIRQLIVATTKKIEKESKSEKKMWTKALKKLEDEPNDSKPSSSSPSPSSPLSPSKNNNNKNNKSNNNKDNEIDESDIDLSEFGIENKKKNNNNQVVTMNSTASYLLFSIFSVGLIGAFLAFGRFRNFKFKF